MRRRPGERAGLDREEVLGAAWKILQRDGVGRLTLRRLAQGLGVAPNAVYGYFTDKQALLDALLDKLVGEIVVPSGGSASLRPPLGEASRGPRGKDWRQGLAHILLATRQLLVAHEELIPMFLSRPGAGPNAQRLGAIMRELLGQAGIQGAAADEALAILLIYALGFAAHEAPRRHRTPHGGGRHPDDRTFVRGLGWLLDGVAATSRA